MNLDLHVMLSSCVPATHMETNGGGTITAEALLALSKHPRALGLAEMMNMPGVLHKDEDILAKLEGAKPADFLAIHLDDRALFLQRFVESAKSWLHVDIYGWTPKAKPGRPEGGECQAARAIFALLSERYG